MDTLFYLLMSIVHSATEFLPISSSGHLLFIKGAFHREDIPLIFDIMVHVGSLAAIVIFYFSDIRRTFGTAGREWAEKRAAKPHCRWLVYLALSTAVTAVFFLALRAPIESLEQNPKTLFPAYGLTTLILFASALFQNRKERPVANRGWFLPVWVGLFQGVAILPGVSRSGSTVSSLLLLGAPKREAAYYSFLLAVPAVLGAFAYKLTDVQSLVFLRQQAWPMLIAFAGSVLSSYFFLALLNWIIRKGKFWMFGFYTLAMAVLSGLWFY